MHIESENYDFLMYTLNAGQPVPSLYIYPCSTTVLGDRLVGRLRGISHY